MFFTLHCLHNFSIPYNLHGRELDISLVSDQAAPAIGYLVTFAIYYCLCTSSRAYNMGEYSVDYLKVLIFVLLGLKGINQSETCLDTKTAVL